MLYFSLSHNARASALVVTVVKAAGLMTDGDAPVAAESLNAYVKVRLLLPAADKQVHQKAKTKVVRRSANPVFDETFIFAGVDSGRLQKRGSALHVSVLNSDTFSRDTLLGELVYSLDETDLHTEDTVNLTRPLTRGNNKVIFAFNYHREIPFSASVLYAYRVV